MFRQFFKYGLYLMVLCCPLLVESQQSQYVGYWKTIDDETNKPRSLVKIYIKEGKLFGDIFKVFPQQGEVSDPLCEKCKGELHNTKIVGLQIISNMELKKGKWSKGTILDPDNGKFYDCKIWIEDNKLKVRGYIGFFYRTQQWVRVEAE